MISFKNKKILITGATGGIGNALVHKFYDAGYNILATGTNNDKLIIKGFLNSTPIKILSSRQVYLEKN